MPDPSNRADKSLPTLVMELWELVRDYARQQTLEPIKGVGRYLLWGMLGALLLGIGLVELSIALLRALQTQTGARFQGTWSWVPYVLTLAASSLVAGMLWSRTRKRRTAR